MARKSTKKPAKKQISPLVKEKQKHLKSLEKHRSQLIKDIDELISVYNAKSVMSDKEAVEWLDRLPLSTLHELEQFSAGRKKDFNLQTLKFRSDLLKSRDSQIEELRKIEDLIYLAKIELLEAKSKELIARIDSP